MLCVPRESPHAAHTAGAIVRARTARGPESAGGLQNGRGTLLPASAPRRVAGAPSGVVRRVIHAPLLMRSAAPAQCGRAFAPGTGRSDRHSRRGGRDLCCRCSERQFQPFPTRAFARLRQQQIQTHESVAVAVVRCPQNASSATCERGRRKQSRHGSRRALFVCFQAQQRSPSGRY